MVELAAFQPFLNHLLLTWPPTTQLPVLFIENFEPTLSLSLFKYVISHAAQVCWDLDALFLRATLQIPTKIMHHNIGAGWIFLLSDRFDSHIDAILNLLSWAFGVLGTSTCTPSLPRATLCGYVPQWRQDIQEQTNSWVQPHSSHEGSHLYQARRRSLGLGGDRVWRRPCLTG